MSAVEASSTESKSAGASRDFAGTWFASMPLPGLQEAVSAWVDARLDPKDVEDDVRVIGRTGGGLVRDQSASVLLGLPAAPDAAARAVLGALPAPRVEVGALRCFPVERVRLPAHAKPHDASPMAATASDGAGEVREYRVLYVDLLPCGASGGLASLQGVQRLLGALFPEENGAARVWHHPQYTPHATVAFVRADAAHKYEGQTLGTGGGAPLQLALDKLIFKAFRDKTQALVEIALRPRASTA